MEVGEKDTKMLLNIAWCTVRLTLIHGKRVEIVLSGEVHCFSSSVTGGKENTLQGIHRKTDFCQSIIPYS